MIINKFPDVIPPIQVHICFYNKLYSRWYEGYYNGTVFYRKFQGKIDLMKSKDILKWFILPY